LTTNYADYVQALIWFGWTDLMRNAGVNTVDGRPKAHVYDAFEEMKNIGRPVSKAIDLDEKADSAYVSYTSTLTNANAVPAGSTFTSRWTFRNSGTATWDDRYHLVYVPAGSHPDPMTDQTRHKLTEVANFSKLAPEQTAVISLDLTAPSQPGRTYRSQWELRDPQEQRIGFLYQDITVVPAPTAGSGARAADMDFRGRPDHSRQHPPGGRHRLRQTVARAQQRQPPLGRRLPPGLRGGGFTDGAGQRQPHRAPHQTGRRGDADRAHDRPGRPQRPAHHLPHPVAYAG
jgi:hypothetical protein